MAQEREERWTHGSEVQIGTLSWSNITYYRSVFGFSVSFYQGQGATVFAPISAPDSKKGLKVESIMIRYSIFAPFTEFGFGGRIWHIYVLDAERILSAIGNLNYGQTKGYEDLRLDHPEAKTYNYGLAVGIMVLSDYFIGASLLTTFTITSVGLRFVKTI
jgi:hypothetical protein